MTSLGKPADEVIIESDAEIRAALKSASIPTLMMSMIHMTGDPSLLSGPIRPGKARNGEVQGFLTEAEKETVRETAFEILKAYRDGKPLPPPPSPAALRAMMSFIVGDPVPEEYVPMMLEELALDGIDKRAFRWNASVPSDRIQSFKVLIIGAGMSGLLAAIRLEEAGIPYEVIEKNDDVGGTWLENRYPGCRVDSPNHFYSFSFEPNHEWPEFFSRRDELHAYFVRCAEKFGIRPRIRFSTEVKSLRFREEDDRWDVVVQKADGREETLLANVVIGAVGQLNRPKLPDIKGHDRFRGAAFHSAQWQSQHDLAGKNIAVIGTGASALQIVPELAKIAGKLEIFQRSGPWIFPNPQYRMSVDSSTVWLLRHVPYYARWYRFLLFYQGSDGLLPFLKIDPKWGKPDRSISPLNEEIRQTLENTCREQVGDDPALLEKVIPKYPPFGNRILIDDGTWIRTLKQDNVELVTDGIREIVEDGIVDAQGRLHPADVIIYATGFHANRFLWPMEIAGRGGRTLQDLWGDEARAYLGITVPDFPNFFILYGPSTNLAHGGSIIFHSECQVRYIMGCIQLLIEQTASSIECREQAFRRYVDDLTETLTGMVWSHRGSRNWYKNERGVVVNTSPWRLVDYWKWAQAPDLADYQLR